MLRKPATKAGLLVSNSPTGMNKLRSIFVFGLLTVAAVSASAQGVLPEQFGRWTRGVCPGWKGKLVFPDTALTKESAQKLVDDEFYCSGQKGVTVIVRVFEDPSGAYEFYTSQLTVGMNPTTIGGATAVDKKSLLALVGNYTVSIEPPGNIADADVVRLLKQFEQNAVHAPLPPIRGYLPDVDMVQGSQKYALGPAGFDGALQALNESKFAAITPEIGFGKGAETMMANYHSANGKTETLILVEYPTPQIAEQQLKHIQPILAANPDLRTATVERKNSLLSLVLSPASAQSAASLRENIKYGISVTWNEGSHTITDAPWLVMVKNIFTGTLVFCGITIVLGIAFGGVRVLTKKFFPGKVFDRTTDREVLQLGLSGKRIDPTDFY